MEATIRFNRYVFRQLFLGNLFVALGVACVIWLTQSLRFIEMIVNQGVTVGVFIYLTGLMLPNFIAVFLPITTFSVVLFVYARMVTDRELVVMRAAGQGQTALAAPALAFAVLIALVCYALNLYLVPSSYGQFRNLQWEARYNAAHILLQEGAFNTYGKNTTVYIRERKKSGELTGILIHDDRKEDKPTTLMAARGAMVDSKDGPRVVMYNGNRQEVDRKTNRMSILYFDRYVFQIDAAKAPSASARYQEARERYLPDLLAPEADPTVPERDYAKFRSEAHRRLVSPLYAVGFSLIALAALMSGGFSRRGQTVRILVAIGTVVGIQILALGLENLAGKMPIVTPLVYINAALTIVFSFLFLVRPNWFTRIQKRTAVAAKG